MNSHSLTLKRWVTVLGSILCLLVSAMLFILWHDRQSGDNAIVKELDVENIRIQRNGFSDIQLSKINQQWQLESPCALPANEQRLTPLLSALMPGTHQYSTSEVDLEAAGLTDPEAIVVLNGNELRIGTTDLEGNRRYVQRDNSVQFAPEWVLSLVNGGVSALAQLEIFAQPLRSITVNDNGGSTRTLTQPEQLISWQALTAQQIAIWPLSDVLITDKHPLRSVDINGRERDYTVYKNDSLTAIQPDGAACAYILPANALPE